MKSCNHPMRRLLVLLLALAMLASLTLPAMAAERSAASSSPDDFNYEVVEENGVEVAHITGYKESGAGGEVVFPETCTIDGQTYAVTGIADKAFCYTNYSTTNRTAQSKITKITVPASIKTVGSSALSAVGTSSGNDVVSSLTEIVFEGEGITFGTNAFAKNPKLTSITLPADMTAVTKNMFYNCTALTEVTLPAFVASVGELAFQNCSALRKVTFQSETPAEMGVVGSSSYFDQGKYPFSGCTELTLLVPKANLENYNTAWSAMLNAGESLAGGITVEGYEATAPEPGPVDPEPDPEDPAPSNEADFNYKLVEEGGKTVAYITGYKAGAAGGEVTLPAACTVEGQTYDVTGVAAKAFMGNGNNYSNTDSTALSKITKIIVPAAIKTVEKQAFNYVGKYSSSAPSGILSSLTEIVFEGEGITFGTNVFGQNPSLTSITLPADMTEITDSMFRKCTALTEFTVPASVTQVGLMAFQDCTALTKVSFQSAAPATMMQASASPNQGEYPFVGCSGLTLSVPVANLKAYQSAWSDMMNAGVTLAGDITIAADGEEDPEVAAIPDFKIYVEGTTAESDFPKYMEYHVTEFDNATKSGKVELKFVGYNGPNLTLTIPETVTTQVLGKDWTFTVVGIGENAMFSHTTSTGSSAYWFSEVSFPSTLEYIGKGGCWSLEKVETIDLSNTKVHTLGSYAFYGCHAAQLIKLPATLKKMGTEASTIIIGSGDNEKEYTYTDNVFACCDALLNIEVAAENPNFKAVDGVLFTKDGKKLIRYPNAKPAEHYDIPEGVEVIASQAFMQSSMGGSVLSTVSFPSTLKEIEGIAFGQSSLTSVTLPLNCKFGTCAFYLSKKLSSVTIPEGVTELGSYMFWSCEKVTEIDCPDSLKKIGDSALSHTGLTRIDLNQVEEIGSYAFYYDKGLTEISIPKTLTTMGTSIFANCPNLANVTMEDGCTTVGDFMFAQDTAITELSLPNSVASIGDCAFSFCTGLESFTMPTGLTEMGESVFYKCWKLRTVTFPDEIAMAKLPYGTFESCEALSYLYLGKNITGTAPVSLYDTNATLIVDCGCSEAAFQRSPFDVYPYDLDDKTLFVKYEAAGTDGNGNILYKTWLAPDGLSGIDPTEVFEEDEYYILYIQSSTAPTFQYDAESPVEPVIFNVYTRTESATEPTLVKGYTMRELQELATSGTTAGYQWWKDGVHRLVAATEYVTIETLLEDADVTFAAGDGIYALDATDYGSYLSYETSQTNKYFITEDAKTEVPAALALRWNSGTGTLEEVAANAYISGNIRFCYGISDAEWAEESALGNRLASNVISIVVVHPDDPVVDPDPDDTPAPKTFEDMPAESDWRYEGLNFMVEAGLLNGINTAGTEIGPDDTMTRAMLVTVLWRLDGEPAAGREASFADLDQNWYQDAVSWAAQNEIVMGVGNGKFEPDGQVTREQIATILCRYAKSKGVDTAKGADLSAFPDHANISGYAEEAMAWCVEAGLIQGSGAAKQLLPGDDATRSEVSAIVMRYEKLEK